MSVVSDPVEDLFTDLSGFVPSSPPSDGAERPAKLSAKESGAPSGADSVEPPTTSNRGKGGIPAKKEIREGHIYFPTVLPPGCEGIPDEAMRDAGSGSEEVNEADEAGLIAVDVEPDYHVPAPIVVPIDGPEEQFHVRSPQDEDIPVETECPIYGDEAMAFGLLVRVKQWADSLS